MTVADIASGSAPPARVTPELLARLLQQSLLAWRLIGRVETAADGSVRVAGLGREIRIGRAPSGLPFRWLVAVDGRERPALSIVAVLRQVRGALDPAYAKVRVRLGVGA